MMMSNTFLASAIRISHRTGKIDYTNWLKNKYNLNIISKLKRKYEIFIFLSYAD